MRTRLAMGYAFVEALLILVALVVIGQPLVEKLTHFTWWGVVSLLVFDVALLADDESPPLFYFVHAAVACTILIGVLGMSITGCTMLIDAALSMGDLAYIVGNGLIHYYPVTRIMIHTPPPAGARPHAMLAAASLLLLYLRLNSAAVVYGCAVSPAAVAAATAAGLLAAYGTEGLLCKYYTAVMTDAQ
jgi:hypothetical protein